MEKRKWNFTIDPETGNLVVTEIKGSKFRVLFHTSKPLYLDLGSKYTFQKPIVLSDRSVYLDFRPTSHPTQEKCTVLEFRPKLALIKLNEWTYEQDTDTQWRVFSRSLILEPPFFIDLRNSECPLFRTFDPVLSNKLISIK